MCFEGIARLSRRVWRRFVRGSREISLVPSLHRASTDALIIHIHHLFSQPAISLPEQAPALISSPNVSTVNGGLHGHRAIVFLWTYIPTTDRGALPWQALSDAIYVHALRTHVFKRALSAYACACKNLSARRKVGLAPKRIKNEWNKWKNHFLK